VSSCRRVVVLLTAAVSLAQATVEVETSYADSGVYKFDRVFDSAFSLEDVYLSVSEVVAAAFNGTTGTIMVCVCVCVCVL
jgi:hypothetical protein